VNDEAIKPLYDELRRELPDVRHDVPLAPYCAYRVGGPARLLVEARTDAELLRALSAGATLGLPITVLGQATNVLIGDGGVPGLVVLTRAHAWTVHEDVLTTASGTVLAELIVDLAERGLGGLEFAANIPGSVGGAVVGNAGAYGRCIADALIDVQLTAPGGRLATVTPVDLQLGYRTSVLKRAQKRRGTATAGPEAGATRAGGGAATAGRTATGPATGDTAASTEAGAQAGGTAMPAGAEAVPADAVVITARFRLSPGSRTALLDEIARDAELRRSKHPLEYASCGSYFKNPSPQRPAARLIEEAGLKGFTIGRAQVSERHANFLVALDGARAADIRALAAEVRRRVEEVHGVRLEEEVVQIGLD
jgi:UDP-N-acetylmuramate dehydrogenase